MSRELHTIAPVYNADSRVLILGSFPSQKSRADGFFYAHPRNRFWQVISNICGEALPTDTDAKRSLLLRHGIALWDVCAECDIHASGDASIRDAVANDITPILEASLVSRIFTNGAAADKLYKRLLEPLIKITAVRLPSTSPANAKLTLDKLCEQWQTIKNFIIDETD